MFTFTIKSSAIALSAAAIIAGCASTTPPRPDRGERAGPPGVGVSGRVLANARAVKSEKGCAEATPAYRAVAALGEGFEIAQAELGACLLTLDGATESESALLQREAMFWLERAAHAGQPSAQRTLAMTYGAADGPLADPAAALSWALVFSKNKKADLFAVAPLPPSLIEAQRGTLDADAIASAEAFAANFVELSMNGYKPPAPASGPSGVPRNQRARRR